MKRSLAKIGVWAWYGAAGVLVLFAALVSLGQYYFPYLGDYREELLQRAALALPFGMDIEGMQAEWTGLAPTFRLQGLRLYAKDDPSLTILSSASSEVRVDIFRSLINLAPRLRSAMVENVELGFIESADGSWHLAGTGARRGPSNTAAIVAFFLAIEEIDLRRAQLLVKLNDGSRVETHDAELLLENYRRFRRLRLTVHDQPNSGTLSLVVEARGDPRRRAEFEASGYVSLDKFALNGVQPLMPAGFALPDAVVDGEMWAFMKKGGDFSLQGALSAPRLPFVNWPRLAQLEPAQNLAMHFLVDHGDAGTTAWIDGLGMDWYGQRIALDRLRLALDSSPERHLALATDYIDIGAAARLVEASGKLLGPWAEALHDLQPYGGLGNALVDVALSAAAPADFRMRARLIDVSVSPWRHAPGIRNAGGYLELDASGGFVDLATGAVSMEFPQIYTDDLVFDSVIGRVSWARQVGDVRVGSDLLSLKDGQTEMQAGFDLEFHRDPALDDQLSLSVGLRNADVDLRRKYLPYKLSADLRNWLENSIKSGTVDRAAMAYHSIFARPEHDASYELQLQFDARDAKINYHPQWPSVEDVSGHVLVDGQRVEVWPQTGRVLQSRLLEGHVLVEPGSDAKRLRVHGRFSGDAADGIQVINESPIATLTDGALRSWRASGAMGLSLDMDIPLGQQLDPATSSLQVIAELDAAKLYLGDYNIPLEQVTGVFDFTLGKGLRSRRIDALLWGKEVHATIGGQDQDATLLDIAIDGRADVARVAEWLNLDPDAYFSGSSHFNLQLDQLRGRGFAATLVSDLVGVDIGLPRPLGKSADSSMALRLAWQPEGESRLVDLDYAGLLRGAMRRSSHGKLDGELSLGGEPVREGEGLRITGAVEDTDAGEWIVASRALIGRNMERGESSGTKVRIDGLRVDSATLLAATLKEVRLDSNWDEGDFVLSFSSDVLEGQFRLPHEREEPYRLSATRLQLQPFMPAPSAPADAETAVAVSAAEPDPWLVLRDVKIPPMLVKIDSLRHGEKDLGRWAFGFSAQENLTQLTDIDAHLPGVHLRGLEKNSGAIFRLSWELERAQSEFRARLDLNDIGALFESWDSPRVLESRRGRAELVFAWPGNPLAFKMADVSGLLDFSLRDGHLTEGSSNNPLVRALGMLSFDEIFRRLKFDFKDLYQTGLSFDRFVGAIDLEQGRASTREPVELKGPAARIRFSGQSDLRSRQVDADLVVTLPIGSNLPWVAALAGGLPAAAGVYVASRLFETQLGKFSSAVYKVSGTLDNPNMELLRTSEVSSVSATPAGPEQGADAGSVGAAVGAQDRASTASAPPAGEPETDVDATRQEEQQP